MATIDNYVKFAIDVYGVGTTFTDLSPSNHTITPNENVKQVTTPYTNNCSYITFDKNGDYLAVADSTDFDFGTGDYTIELWVYPTDMTTATNIDIVSFANDKGNFGIISGGYLMYWDGSTAYSSSPHALSLNAWQHIMLTLSSGTGRMFISGTKVKEFSSSANLDGDRRFNIGGRFNGLSGWYGGYMTGICISKGIARKTSDYTPSIYPYGLYRQYLVGNRNRLNMIGVSNGYSLI